MYCNCGAGIGIFSLFTYLTRFGLLSFSFSFSFSGSIHAQSHTLAKSVGTVADYRFLLLKPILYCICTVLYLKSHPEPPDSDITDHLPNASRTERVWNNSSEE
jgi:hypothetical protein